MTGKHGNVEHLEPDTLVKFDSHSITGGCLGTQRVRKLKCITYVSRIVHVQLKVRNGPKSRKLLGPMHATQHGGEVPLELLVITVCPGNQLF